MRLGLVRILCVTAMLPSLVHADDLRVLTLNLRSHLDDAEHREPAIAAFLASVRPDVVLLQEVANVPGAELTQAHRLARTCGYEVSACFNQKSERGLAVLSRFPIVDSVVETYSASDRPILGVTLNIGGRLVSVVDVHLTPAMAMHQMRRGELEMALQLLADLPNGMFIAGDFNFGDGAPEASLVERLTDAWRVVEPRAPGYTWDLKNPLAKKNSFPMEPNRRLDHILLQSTEARVSSCRIVLDSPSPNGIWPSDHFGLLASVELPHPPVAGASPTRPGGTADRAAAPAASH